MIIEKVDGFECKDKFLTNLLSANDWYKNFNPSNPV
jgi:hypothetical protein